MDMDTEPKILSLISQLICHKDRYINVETVNQIVSQVISMDVESQPNPESELMSLIAQAISVFNLMDLDSQPEPMSKVIQFITQKQSLPNSVDDSDSVLKQNSEFTSLLFETRTLEPEPELMLIIDQIFHLVLSMDSESKLNWFISQLASLKNTMELDPDSDWDSKFISVVTQIVSLIISMDMESHPKPESEIMSLVTQTVSVFNSMDLDSQPKPLSELISLISQNVSLDISINGLEFMSAITETQSLEPKPELISLIDQILSVFTSTETEFMSLVSQTWKLKSDNLEPDSKLTSLLYQLISLTLLGKKYERVERSELRVELLSLISVISKVVSHVSSLDLDLLPKPHTEVISLFSHIMSLARSIPGSETEREFISLITQMISHIRSVDLEQDPPHQLLSILADIGSHLYSMDSKSKLGSPIKQLESLLVSRGLKSEPEEVWELDQLISLSPQLKVELVQGKIHVTGKVERQSIEKGRCQPKNRQKIYLVRGEDASHFLCKDCNGEDHEECVKTQIEVKHLLHPKHSLQFVLQQSWSIQTRKCFCCDEDLLKFFYYCSACDYAMNVACAEKPPVLSIDHPKWHQHTLALFPRRAFLTCNVCALADASSPIYMCPPCDFVVHLRCISLPRVIRISRHPHRISFTPSFDKEDCFCGVCRRKIDNNYGSYSCIKNGCSYAAHSRCATQRNVWDGIELEGMPEDIEEEEAEPFVRISDGIIQHFSHQQHHLRLDENINRDYDDNKQCQACITPIYFGNFYSCLQCDFILHEECADLSRKIYHPIHPHRLTLVERHDGVMKYGEMCSACPSSLVDAFTYECGKEGCRFKLHVQCATVSEPLAHESHRHPLFLTSKPGEQRACSVCQDSRLEFTKETFNCIECEFALCFGCATSPQKVRYKHDKHVLTLSYGKETSTLASWCEICEGKVNLKKRFYTCDEYCCVTLHIECLIEKDLYMELGSSFNWKNENSHTLRVLPNNHMSRPFCLGCRKRCPYKTVLQDGQLSFCSTDCLR